MSGRVTWEQFLHDATEFLKVSDDICDGWTLRGNPDKYGQQYLVKSLLKPVGERPCAVTRCTVTDEETWEDVGSDSEEVPLPSLAMWEYHVLYSSSYGVPVLFFHVCSEAGRPLSLKQVWECTDPRFCATLPENRWSTLTQQEHPLLRRPFFQLHPCRTAELLQQLEGVRSNSIVTWLSSVGPVVGLEIPLAYASLTSTAQPLAELYVCETPKDQ